MAKRSVCLAAVTVNNLLDKSGLYLTLLDQHYPHTAFHQGHGGQILLLPGYYWPVVLVSCQQTTDWSIWVKTVSRVHVSSSPVVGVPGETGLLSAGVSGQCRPPHCGPQVAAGEAAPSRFAPLRFLVASLLDPQQAQSVLGSAIENPRCLLSVKAQTWLFLVKPPSVQNERMRLDVR